MHNDDKKTLEYLDSRPWYRSLKILNAIFVVLCYLVAFASVISFLLNFQEVRTEMTNFLNYPVSRILAFGIFVLYIIWSTFWAWLISQLPKWAFFYVYLGSIKPKK